MRDRGTFRSLTAIRRTRCAPHGMILPRLVRRCFGFDNDCPEFWWGERPREPRRPESKIFRSDFLNGCPGVDCRRPTQKNTAAATLYEFILTIQTPPTCNGRPAPPSTPACAGNFCSASSRPPTAATTRRHRRRRQPRHRQNNLAVKVMKRKTPTIPAEP